VNQSLPFLFNAEEIALDNAVYRLSIASFVPEIFGLKLEDCLIFDISCLPKF